ncbi:MAG: hypothetical protein ABUL60_21110 [Myxococcales bacterium]
MMNVRGFAVAAVFLVGCAVGGVSSQLLVPKASAQQAASLPQWEYTCPILEREEMVQAGNRLGAERWELSVTLPGTPNAEPRWCFKRPKL